MEIKSLDQTRHSINEDEESDIDNEWMVVTDDIIIKLTDDFEDFEDLKDYGDVKDLQIFDRFIKDYDIDLKDNFISRKFYVTIEIIKNTKDKIRNYFRSTCGFGVDNCCRDLMLILMGIIIGKMGVRYKN